jgi:hypothetical protein
MFMKNDICSLNGGFFDKQSEVGGLNLAQMLESWN